MIKLLRTALVLIIFSQLFFSCSNPNNGAPSSLKVGKWRGILHPQGQRLPFNFDVEEKNGDYSIYLINDKERLLLDSITFKNDSVYISLHIFDADLVAKVYPDSIVGYWTKNFAKNYIIPFKAYSDVNYRFPTPSEKENYDFTGRYEVTFVHNEKDTTKAVGIFKQTGFNVTGTFLTPTGDYRYLEGISDGKNLMLSTFDGEHAFLFKAFINEDSTLSGEFWSGKTWNESWTAIKDENAKLKESEQLSRLKEGFTSINFKFPGLNGELVSPTDDKYKNKVLVLQLFGTWCPNCMDETKFLSKWYNDNRTRGVEVIGLAYETKDDYEYAKSRILKMKRKLGVNYDFVVAGTKDKEEASKTLPMLTKIGAFPTLILIDKKGDVRKIHTGFTGPGTGDSYMHFIKDFDAYINELLNE